MRMHGREQMEASRGKEPAVLECASRQWMSLFLLVLSTLPQAPYNLGLLSVAIPERSVMDSGLAVVAAQAFRWIPAMRTDARRIRPRRASQKSSLGVHKHQIRLRYLLAKKLLTKNQHLLFQPWCNDRR